MTELPSGTVTFLFTDIEHSTETAAALGDQRWADALQAHRALLRPCFERHSGVEVGTEGDAFFVAFARAGDAVKAAVEGQRALRETELRTRMGLHTGEALVRDRGYMGHEVHRAKRISDAGHGGQILLSETTADLVRGSTELIDLGPHRLKDLGDPQRIYQLLDESLERDFPPLRSLEAFTHSLPLQRSPFIGREKEMVEVRMLLEANRIVTLTGVGGCGKTRLAQQLGAELIEDFADGVFFINLAPVADPNLIDREIVASVGVPLGGAGGMIGAAAVGPMRATMLRYLAPRHALLILDNCEHVIDGCAEIADQILARAPEVRILATSREGLRIEGEQTWTVPSLSVPSLEPDAAMSESVSLFKARASAVRADFELTPDNIGHVAEICRRLDGIPLAIEFAAARVVHLSPKQIAERLDDRFRLLTGGQRRVQRQHTLQAALDWSYELLSEAERRLLRRLAVFAGDFSLEAAAGICADEGLESHEITDLLGALVAKSLIETVEAEEVVRYRMLETVRAYAAEQLARAGEADRFRASHRDWFLRWVCSTPWPEAFQSLSYTMALRREEQNLYAALDWCVAEGRPDLLAALGTRLFTAWMGGLPWTKWTGYALEHEQELDRDDRVRLLAQVWTPTDNVGASFELAGRAVAASEGASTDVRIYALSMRAFIGGVVSAVVRDGDLRKRAHEDADEASELAADSSKMRVWVVFVRGTMELSWGEVATARSAFEEALELAERNADLVGGISMYLAVTAHIMDDHEAANEAADLVRRSMDRIIGMEKLESLEGLDRFPLGFAAPPVAIDAVAKGGTADEWRFLAALRPHAVRSGIVSYEADLLLACGILCYFDGDHERASKLISRFRAHTLGAGVVPTASDYVLYLHYRDLIRRELDPQTAKRLRSEGEAMSLEEALDLAFSRTITA